MQIQKRDKKTGRFCSSGQVQDGSRNKRGKKSKRKSKKPGTCISKGCYNHAPPGDPLCKACRRIDIQIAAEKYKDTK